MGSMATCMVLGVRGRVVGEAEPGRTRRRRKIEKRGRRVFIFIFIF